MSIEKRSRKEGVAHEYAKGDVVRIVPRTKLFEMHAIPTVLYEVTSVSKDPDGYPIVFARPRGTNEKPKEIPFMRLEKVTIQ